MVRTVAFSCLFFWLSFAAEARRRSLPAEEALDGRLLWGKCLPKEDPGVTKNRRRMFPSLCANAKVASQLLFREDIGDRNIAQNYARVYTGLHGHEYVSFHGSWIRKRVYEIGRDNAYRDDTKPENVFLQLGNNSVHRLRLQAGKLRVPFGIDDRPLLELLDEVKPSNYWRSPQWGVVGQYDTLVSSQYAVGYASSRLRDDSELDDHEEVNEAVGMRSMFDVTATDAFRFVVSAYGDRVGQRRLGFGFVTITHKGDGTTFEWVRLRHRPDGEGDHPFDQIFRLVHVGRYRAGTRWVGEYEDQHRDYRRLTVGHDFFLPDYGTFRMATAFTRQIEPEVSDYWLIMAGMELKI